MSQKNLQLILKYDDINIYTILKLTNYNYVYNNKNNNKGNRKKHKMVNNYDDFIELRG